MPQLFLYVPDEIAEALQQRAAERGLSLSRYLAELAKREIGEGWPENFFKQVIGGWHGDPLERAPQGEVEVRKELK